MPRSHFYKLILSSTLRAKQLRIPENFLRKIRDELSTVATLLVPDGHVWRIGLKKADNKFWLQDGWQEFIDHYSIRVGYFLLFRYEGKSNFNVYIYNLKTSEIDYQSTTLGGTQRTTYANQSAIFEELEDDDSASDSLKDTVFQEVVDKQKSSKVSIPFSQNLFNGSSTNKKSMNWTDEEDPDSPKHADNSQTELQPKRRGRKKQKTDSNEHGPSTKKEGQVTMRIRFYESASIRKRPVTTEERDSAINSAKAFNPINPFCRVVLRPSYLYKGCIMYLPSCFAEKSLCGVSGFIKLQIWDGRQWPVRCLYRGGRAKLSQGWYEFSSENNLEEGDVCVFELIKGKEITLKVTIFRVVEDVKLMTPPPTTWPKSLSRVN